MLKITKTKLVKRFHKQSKQRRKEKQKIFMQYYSEYFLCSDCEDMCHRSDEYPCDGSDPGRNICLDCLISKRSERRSRDYHLMVHKYCDVVGMSVEQAQKYSKHIFELHEWYGGEIFGYKYVPRYIRYRY